MRLFRWVQIIIGKAERGLWYDHDQREYDPKGYGICLKFYGGHVFRPIPKPRYWLQLLKGNTAIPDSWDQFNRTDHWMIHFWFPLLPFFSIALGEMGVYAGFKTFSLENERYRKWGVGPDGAALTPSISTRMTRWT